MVRFVNSPDNVVTPDIFEKLPGRGVWVTANRMSVKTAMKKKAFCRGFKTRVKVPDDLDDQVEAGLLQRILGLLGMAMKSGQIFTGYDQVQTVAGSDYLALRIEASDGSPDGRGKIRVLTKAISHELEKPETPVIGCFSAHDLGRVLGFGRVVHAATAPGSISRSLTQAALRLAGFRDMVPAYWPDRHYETELKSATGAGS